MSIVTRGMGANGTLVTQGMGFRASLANAFAAASAGRAIVVAEASRLLNVVDSVCAAVTLAAQDRIITISASRTSTVHVIRAIVIDTAARVIRASK
jgi:hypothetical protein